MNMDDNGEEVGYIYWEEIEIKLDKGWRNM